MFKNEPGNLNENGRKAPPTETAKPRFYQDLERADADYWASSFKGYASVELARGKRRRTVSWLPGRPNVVHYLC